MRILWIICIAVTVWFALAPAAWGGLGGQGYHGMAFLLLGVLTPAAFPRLKLTWAWLLLVGFGGGIEIAQSWNMSAQRHGEWVDWYVDIAAVSIGIVLWALWRYRVARIATGKQRASASGMAPASQEQA